MKHFHGFQHFLVFMTCLIALLPSLRADRILSNLDFSSGDWSVIGVPIHNVQMLPVQSELGTFVLKDKGLMNRMKQQWDLNMTFQDKCDYHYELKFYRNGDLKRTLKVNLVCATLYDDGLSYSFSPQLFEEIRKIAKPVDWSRISFGNLDVLRKAIRVLDNTPGIYWYKDIQPYRYSGYFMIRVLGIPWEEDIETVHTNVHDMVQERIQSQDFYLQEFLTTVVNDKRAVKYYVYCEKHLADRYGSGQYIPWRTHFTGKDSIQIVAIGVDIRKYMQLMGKGEGVRTRTDK